MAPRPPVARPAPPVCRGRPRCAESHARILAATTALLERTSFGELTVEAIASRARVGKQTIYRWWGGKPSLVMEASLAAMQRRVLPVDTGDVALDLVTFLKRSGRNLRQTSAGRTLAVLIGEAQRDPAFAEAFRARFMATRREALRALLERAVDRGALRGDVDLELVIDLLFGTFWYRLLSGRAALDNRFVEQLAALVLPSILTPGAARAASGS